MNINCTSCGASIKLPEGETFILCPFCDTSLYIDKSKVVFHYWVKPTVDKQTAHSNLLRWMSGNSTVEKLELNAKIDECLFFYFPFWRFVIDKDGRETVLMEPAGATVMQEIRFIDVPAGSLVFYDHRSIENPEDFNAVDITYDKIINKITSTETGFGVNTDNIKQASLVHIPFYRFIYNYENGGYAAVVEGATGEVFASIFPEKLTVPYTGITVVSIIVLFLEGILIADPIMRLFVMSLTGIPIASAALYIVNKY